MRLWPEPRRWSGERSELAAAIRDVRASQASAAEIAALERRLLPQLATPAAVSGALLRGALAPGVWLSIALAAGLATFATLRPGPPPPARPLAPPPTAAVPPAQLEPASRDAPVAPPPPPAPARVSRPRARRSPAEAASVEAELTLLARAQAALDASPATTLELTQQHAVAYARGAFRQEREILAIEALFKLRRRAAAQARAAEFVARYPDSPHARRLAPLLGQATSPPGGDHP